MKLLKTIGCFLYGHVRIPRPGDAYIKLKAPCDRCGRDYLF